MHYIIQDNTFKKKGYQKLIDMMERFNLSYDIVKVLPFVEEIELKPYPKNLNVFGFGSLKLARLLKKYDFYPGIVINENFDYGVYSQHYKENLLNYDSRIVNIFDDFEWEYEQQFIRPCLDTKVFTGKVFDKNEWYVFIKRVKKNPQDFPSINNDTKIQISMPKKIFQEVRCWVVDGKIITSSIYRRGSFIVQCGKVDDAAIEFAQKMVDEFQLADTFVIDVCETRNGWKIVECGCTSIAGFYDSDVQKLIMALEEKYNKM